LNAKNFGHFLGISVLRAWLAFSALGVLGFVFFWFMDRDNPLRSDDPYVVGFAFGIVAACCAIVYTVTERIAQRVGRTQLRDSVYAILLAAWCLLLWAGSRGGGEGSGVLAFSAAASLVIGLLTYPLCRYKSPRVLVTIMSCTAVLLLAMYCVVCIRMAQRY